MKCSIVRNKDTKRTTVSAFVPGRGLLQADNTHPNFQVIKATASAVAAGDDTGVDEGTFADLFDTATTLAIKFKDLSRRVTVANGRLYFDGDEVNGALTEHVLDYLQQGSDDWKPLVAFWEKLAANPNAHSREQAYEWIAATNGLTILENGNILGYKGLQSDRTSCHAGPAIVDGEEFNGHVPNAE